MYQLPRHFRNEKVTAPLKPSVINLLRPLWHHFRNEKVTAPLKHDGALWLYESTTLFP